MTTKKVFVLGPPGSGKSTVAQYILNYVNQHTQPWNWKSVYVSDYPILYRLYQADKQQDRFRSAPYEGFEVLLPSVYKEALVSLKEEARFQQAENQLEAENLLIITEFARSNYHEAFQQLPYDFLQHAYFLFLDADILTCIHRVRWRVTHKKSFLDDHFVPLKAFKNYYKNDNRSSFSSALKAYGIDEERVLVIENIGTPQAAIEKARDYIEWILKQEGGNPVFSVV